MDKFPPGGGNEPLGPLHVVCAPRGRTGWYKHPMFGIAPRTARLWLAVGAVLVLAAAVGYLVTRPDAFAWGRADGATAAGVTQDRGDDACGQGDLVVLDIAPEAALGVSGTFVRDDAGVLSEAELRAHFARDNGSIRRYGPDATLPEDATETGWTRGDGARLWLRPSADDYSYVVAGDVVEAWPRAEPPLICD